MTDESIKSTVRQILTNYLEMENRRKTPERFAILDEIYNTHHHFSLEELGTRLEKAKFYVSRATLYNTMKLLMKLRLVISHHFQGGTLYEACYKNQSHCHQICTMCGSVLEIPVPEVGAAIENARFHRFRRSGFTLYVYGICSNCQGKLTRQKNLEAKMKQQKSK